MLGMNGDGGSPPCTQEAVVVVVVIGTGSRVCARRSSGRADGTSCRTENNAGGPSSSVGSGRAAAPYRMDEATAKPSLPALASLRLRWGWRMSEEGDRPPALWGMPAVGTGRRPVPRLSPSRSTEEDEDDDDDVKP